MALRIGLLAGTVLWTRAAGASPGRVGGPSGLPPVNETQAAADDDRVVHLDADSLRVRRPVLLIA